MKEDLELNNIVHENYRDLAKVAQEFKKSYLESDPFPHICFKNFFVNDFLNQVKNELPDLSKIEQAIQRNHKNALKFALRDVDCFEPFTKKLSIFLNSPDFLSFLNTLTSIERDLQPDVTFFGGGVHEIKRGGFLKIHADFNRDETNTLDRRLNLLVYLNDDWKEEYGGNLELWNADMTACKQSIVPEFNTMVIFSTTDTSFHGHPDILKCPDNKSRKSFATYYYTDGRPKEEIDVDMVTHSTLYKKRKNNKNDQETLKKRVTDKIRKVKKRFLS